MNALDPVTAIIACCVVGLFGGVLIHYGVKGLKR